MEHSLRSAGSRIDFLTPTVALAAASSGASTPPSTLGAHGGLSGTRVSRGKQGLAMMGAGADLVSVKTTQLSGTDVTFITSSPSCLLCQKPSLSTASPTHLQLCAIPFESLLSPRVYRSQTPPPRPRRRSVACQDVLVALLVGHHRNPSPSSALVCCIASAERYLTQDPSRKRRRWRQALAPAAFGGCTTGQAPRRCCGDRSKTSRRLDILHPVYRVQGRHAMAAHLAAAVDLMVAWWHGGMRVRRA